MDCSTCLKYFILVRKKSASRCIPHMVGRQEPSAKILRSPLATLETFHFRGIACCVVELNGGLLPRCQSEEMILIDNNSFDRVGIEPTAVALQSHLADVPL